MKATSRKNFSPIILVGMPRSGSTLMTRVINDSFNCLMINDFYYLQFTASVGGFDKNSSANLLIDYIVKMIKERVQPKDGPRKDDGLTYGLALSEKNIKELEDYSDLLKIKANEDLDWGEILCEVLEFSASLSGKTLWGYNTPQDYLNVDQILGRFPSAKIIYLLRSPQDTLRSYKYYWTMASWVASERGRYHPIAQSILWKLAAQSYIEKSRSYPDNVILVKLEDFVGNTKSSLERIASFTGIEFSDYDVNLDLYGKNSSMHSNSATKSSKKLDQLELRICDLITSPQQEALGIGLKREDNSRARKYRLGDWADFISTSVRFSLFYSIQLINSGDIRKRAEKVMGEILKSLGSLSNKQ